MSLDWRTMNGCARCGDGIIAVWVTDLSYAGRGPLRDDATGVAEDFCNCPMGRARADQRRRVREVYARPEVSHGR